MLEDPTHQDVARWGKDGDTFVVEDVRNPGPMAQIDSNKNSGRALHTVYST